MRREAKGVQKTPARVISPTTTESRGLLLVAAGVNSGTINNVTGRRAPRFGSARPFRSGEAFSGIEILYEVELRASVDRRRAGFAPLRGPNGGEESLNFLLEVIALF
jgi:hypothetical protein